jgi:hypothetical protein
MNTYPPIEDRRDTPLVGFIKGAICFALMFGFACIAQSATIPALVHSAGSQPYNFDRIDASEIAWYSALYGPNEIPSAPIRLHSGAGNGHTEHGQGHGYGHEKHHHATPEPGTAVMCAFGAAWFIARSWRWKV